MDNLYIPEGINYECEGCGKCCGGWAVPMTPADYEKVSRHDWAQIAPDRYKGVDLFRPMKEHERVGLPYTHAIKQAENGHCPFLVDNLCFIHKEYGALEKPAICRLFPYSFNETPSGVYLSLSFNSMAVAYNSGKALTDQREYLEKKWQDHQNLYPGHHPNWSTLKYAVGMPMTWEQYLDHESHLLELMNDHSMPVKDRLLKGSEYLASKLANSPPAPSGSLNLKRMDKHVLVALHKIYFPTSRLGRGEGDFNVGRFFYQLSFQGTRLKFPGQSFSFEDLEAYPWPENDPDIESLLYRYFFSRMFGKFYFGAGFGQVSLIAGFHHLIMVAALIKLQSKGNALLRQAPQVSMVDVVTTVRALEKRLGETVLDGYAAALWELLMYSPARAKRVCASI